MIIRIAQPVAGVSGAGKTDQAVSLNARVLIAWLSPRSFGKGSLVSRSRTNSTPIKYPRPRTSPTSAKRSRAPRSEEWSNGPRARTRSSSPSRSMMRCTARPAAQAAVCPGMCVP